ncbi:hypothetical protein EMCRGX_G026344 [Ephydatia muelleri]
MAEGHKHAAEDSSHKKNIPNPNMAEGHKCAVEATSNEENVLLQDMVEGQEYEDRSHKDNVQNRNVVQEHKGLAEDNFNEGNVQYQNAVGHKHLSLVLPNVISPERYQAEEETLLILTQAAEKLRHFATSQQFAAEDTSHKESMQYSNVIEKHKPSSEGYEDPSSHFRAYLASKGIQRPELSPLKSTFVPVHVQASRGSASS